MARTKTYRTRAIVLRQTKLSETDLILTLLGDDGCEHRAVAKGARKPGGRLAGRSELFDEVDILIARGRNLGVVTEAQLVDAHRPLRDDIDRMNAAFCVLEVARLTCFEDAPDAFLYPICSRALRACEEASDRAHLDLVVAAYAFKVLAHGGWYPQVGECVACGDEHPTRFSVLAGGALCESCSRDVAGAEPLDSRQFAWVRSLLMLTFDQLLAAEVDEPTAALLVSLSHAWASTHLDTRLPSFEFLSGM